MINLTDISQCFDKLKPGIEAIKAKTNAVWSLDDVYNHCIRGEWLLFTDPDVDGFLMVSVNKCQYTGSTILEINCAYYNDDHTVDPTEVYLPFLKILANQLSVQAIEVRSPRRGWERKGFRPVDIIYRMEV